MSKLALPFAALVVLVVGCQQAATAEQAQDKMSRASGKTIPTDFQTEEAPADAGVEDPAAGHKESATCVVGGGKQTACTISFGPADNEASRVVAFKVGSDSFIFRGNSQGRWWSGTLNGKQAMGYELNRGHVVFSNQALDQQFEYWTKGNEHGNY